MKLFVSGTSPFARKALMVVIEKGLTDHIEIEQVNPWINPPQLVSRNPLSQIPTLVLEDGEALYDSRVICAYLDELAEPRLLPAGGRARARVLRMEALADGITDAAVMVRMARVANPGAPDSEQMVRQIGKINAALEVMQRDAATFGSELHLGMIAYGAALGYLDFRFPDFGWRERAGDLAVWYASFSERPSMRKTAPVE